MSDLQRALFNGSPAYIGSIAEDLRSQMIIAIMACLPN
jgi:hypothetical protein